MLVHRLDAHRLEVHRLEGLGIGAGGADGDDAGGVHRVGGAVIAHQVVVGVGEVDLIVIVGLCAGDVGSDKSHVGGGIVGGQLVAQGVHKILGGDGGDHFAVHVHPVFIPQGEGPGERGLVKGPLGGEALFHDALVVKLQQRIHAVGAHHHLDVRRGGQVVQGGGLAGIQNGIAGSIGRGCARGGPGGAGTAGAEQPGGADGGGGHAGRFEKLAARKDSTHEKLPFIFES